MSEHNPGAGGRDESRPTYEPADESAASVFGEPSRPRAPAPPGPPPGGHGSQPYPGAGRAADAAGYRPPATQIYHQPPAQAPPRDPYAPGHHPPPAQAPPRDPYGPGNRPPPGSRRPPGQAGSDPGRRPGSPAADQGDRSARRSGPGLPFGLGALVGVAGAACLLAALMVLPWFEAGGREVTLSDLRTAFTVAETSSDDPAPEGPDATTPDLSEGVPSPDEVTDAVEQQARDAAGEAVAAAIDSGRSRYLELYTDVLWMAVAGVAVLAVVFSTILSPRSFALSLLLGFRRLSGAATVLAGLAHGVALWVVFTGTGAPEPAFGVWLGVAGLVGVLLACIIGPKK